MASLGFETFPSYLDRAKKQTLASSNLANLRTVTTEPPATESFPAPPAPPVDNVNGTPVTPGTSGATLTSADFFSPKNMGTSFSNLGFGQKPTTYTAPTIAANSAIMPAGATPTGATPTAGSVAAPPSISAPQVKAEQAGFKDFDALQKSIYQGINDPTQREIQRQQQLASDKIRAEQAQMGISDSGAGQALRQQQDTEYLNQAVNASKDAANQASTQRYGLEYTQSLDNAKLRQDANLANAGFSLTAQTENARNLLTASITSAQLATQASIAGAQNMTQASIAGAANQTQASIAGSQIASSQAIAQANMQLQTMGLNQQSEQNARGSFLQLMGIQESDLARQDAFDMDNLALFYNTYLKQLATVGQIGTASFGKGDTSSSSFNLDTGISASSPLALLGLG